jgi:hypothetical protein
MIAEVPSWGVVAEYAIETNEATNIFVFKKNSPEFKEKQGLKKFAGKKYKVTFPLDWPECKETPYVEELGSDGMSTI